MKYKLAVILDKLMVSVLFWRLSMIWYGKSHIRVINYHNTPNETMYNFEEQVKLYKSLYEACSFMDLVVFFNNKKWHKAKPGLIITFDDGLLSNYLEAVPILEKYGFTGWFCIPSQFIDTAADKQNQFMAKHNIFPYEESASDRMAMDWPEIKDLIKRNHVIASHTYSHHRMIETDSDHALRQEVLISKKEIEEKTGSKIDVFCWVGGEEQYYTPKAAKFIQEAGYKFSFMTNNHPITRATHPLQIQRTNIESSFPLPMVKLSLCGLYDIFYWAKRVRVNMKTAILLNS